MTRRKDGGQGGPGGTTGCGLDLAAWFLALFLAAWWVIG